VASEIGDLYVILRAITDPFKTGLKEAAAEGEAATGTIGGAFQKLAGVGVIAGGAALAVGAVSVKWAADFESATTRLVTSAGETKQKLDMVRQGLLDMAGQVGVNATDLAKSMYYVEAAGYHAGDGLTVLKAAAQGAAAEGADTTTVAQALTDVLKDYHLQASAAGDVTSKMIAAVAHGKTNLQDFSSAFASIVPAASAAGIGFNDVGSALSEMTNHGFTAQRASQDLAQALRSLLNPTKPMKTAFDEFGVSADTLRAKLHDPNGLTDAMQYLAQSATKAGKEGTPEFAAALKTLMGTAAGANAALTTVGANFDDTSATIKAMAGATVDAQGKVSGFALVQQNFSQQLKQAEASVVSMGIKLGTILLPYVEKFLGWIQQGIGWLVQHKGAVEMLAGAIGTTLVAAVIAIGGALASAVGPEMAIAAGIMAAGSAVVYAYNHFKTFREIVDDIGRFLAGAFAAAWKAAGVVIDWFRKDVLPAVKTAIKDVIDWFEAHKEDFRAAWDGTVKAVQAVVKWFDENVLKWVRARIAELISWWYDHSQEITEVWSAVWKVVETAFKVFWDGFMKPALSEIESVWSIAWGLIKDNLKMVWDLISGIVTMSLHNIENVIGLVLDIITGNWGKVWGDLKKLVSQAWDDVVNLLKSVGGDALHLLEDAGKNIVKGLINGIKSMAGGVSNVMGDITSGIRSFLPFSPAKEGPLSGAGSPDIAGAKIGSMLADGMHRSVSTVASASNRLASAAALSVGGGPGGALSGLAAVAPAAGGAPTYVVNVNVQGSIHSDRDIRDVVEQQMYRLGMRQSTTWQNYTRR
jgi:TP901 family phage tail tape measure protein